MTCQDDIYHAKVPQCQMALSEGRREMKKKLYIYIKKKIIIVAKVSIAAVFDTH